MFPCSETQGLVQPGINEGVVVAGAIAMANLCMPFGSRATESTQSLRQYQKPFVYNPPAASRFPQYYRGRRPSLVSTYAAQPITAVDKKEGFGKGISGSMMNALWFWDDESADQADDVKFKPQFVKGESSSETKHDTQLTSQRKLNNRTKKDPACEKGIIYAVLVGSVVVVMVSLSYSRNGVVPYDKFRRSMMLQDLSVTCGLYCQVCYRKMLNILNDITPFTLQLTNAYQCYLMYSRSNVGRMTNIKPQTTNVTFDDVEGADSAKAELLEIVGCINGDGKYKKLGAKVPKGVLLAGPPGTGKTLLARAVAGEAGVPFFSLSGSEFVEVFVGVGAARIRDIFHEARKISPAIIFIDEIDAIGGKRGRSLNCESDQMLNQLLTEMDGFEKDDGTVVVIAATNRPESLDPALMRPGRLSRKVFVGAPDEDGRRKIFALYLRNVLMNENKEAVANLVASRTPGLTGAGLEEIANESVRLAVRRDGDFVTSDDVLQAIDKFKAENDIRLEQWHKNRYSSPEVHVHS